MKFHIKLVIYVHLIKYDKPEKELDSQDQIEARAYQFMHNRLQLNKWLKYDMEVDSRDKSQFKMQRQDEDKKQEIQWQIEYRRKYFWETITERFGHCYDDEKGKFEHIMDYRLNRAI